MLSVRRPKRGGKGKEGERKEGKKEVRKEERWAKACRNVAQCGQRACEGGEQASEKVCKGMHVCCSKAVRELGHHPVSWELLV